jgi:hypothetical protein
MLFLAVLIFTFPILFAPSEALVKRLSFLLIGVAVIFGLSEVSKQVERLRTAAATVETH